ncbi:MAG: nucleotide exchange factor GrpE [bacterium]
MKQDTQTKNPVDAKPTDAQSDCCCCDDAQVENANCCEPNEGNKQCCQDEQNDGSKKCCEGKDNTNDCCQDEKCCQENKEEACKDCCEEKCPDCGKCEDCCDCKSITTDKNQTDITKLINQIAIEKEGKLLALADFQNYKRRTEQERMEWMTMASKAIVQKLIELVNDINRAESNDSKDQAKLLAGYKMVFEKINQLLTEQGLKAIKIKVGDKFDPKTMAALTTVPVDQEKKDNTVIHVDEIGFLNEHKGSVYKMAKVVIGKYGKQ